MKELEDTHCEVRKIIDLQSSLWERLNNSGSDDSCPSAGSQSHKCSARPLGGFLNNAMYAWLSCGSRFAVINVKTAENVAMWTFREEVSCVSQFPVQNGQIPLLLVGLDNGANRIKDSLGMVCVFDCSTSRVLRAIQMPAGVEKICVVNGGAEWEENNDRTADGILSENCGTACAVLRSLHHVIFDLRRPLWDGNHSGPIMDESYPTEIEFLHDKEPSSSRQQHRRGRHAAYNLLNRRIEDYIRFNRDEFEAAPLYRDSLGPAIVSSAKIGCLISGCLGRVIMWQSDGSVGWVSLPIDENMSVSHIALLEPADDPRPFYYLWVAYQEESMQMAPILRMYALLFERKYSEKGTNLYYNLEGEPSLKFEVELDEGDRITDLSTIERDGNQEQTESTNKRGEDSLLLIGLNGRTLLFDLNQWYKEQMPRTPGECQNPNSILVSYRTKSELQNSVDDAILSCAYVPATLREFQNNGPNPPEELFYPSSLSLEWLELTSERLTFWMTRGKQSELLREMAVVGPIIMIQPSETYHKCLAAGLIPFNAECSFNSDQNAQRETLLSLCLEQRWATFLIRCAKEWSDGSASYLFPAFLKWGVQRASSIKITADRLCIPLFDQSGSNIGEAEVRTLRFCCQQLECLTNVVAKLPVESSDLTKQRRALKRISTHLQVVLWFHDVGLLPETQEVNEQALPISFALRIPYPCEKLATLYRDRRSQLGRSNRHGEMCEDLFIDELITRECAPLRAQWEREGGDISMGGHYPPPSLQSLLRSYLMDCHQPVSDEIENKHQITIYLLMDLAMLLQGSCPGVDQLIKYPAAFKMSPSLIKLTQAFWLLDHEDYQGFLDMMTGQLVSDSDVKDWHHKLVLRTLVGNDQHKLALTYLRVRKPPMSTVEDQGVAISLSVEHGLVQSAFHCRPPSHYSHLLTCFFEACRASGKLNDILHLALNPDEEEAFVKFLEDGKYEESRLLYYLQRCRYAEANNVYSLGQSRGLSSKAVQPASVMMLNAYSTTLPEVTRYFSDNLNRRNVDVDPELRYPRPMSHRRSCSKTSGIYETVIQKARETYVRGDRCHIPFISAPCTSLRSNGTNVNTNCVLFPVLARKTYGKRTLDDMREDEETGMDNTEERKRRKISDESDSIDKSDPRKLRLSAVLDTPLVQRKKQAVATKDTALETPHSILKIRQLIRSSTSPSLVMTRSGESQEKDSTKERERKSARQIRFSVGQIMNDSTQEGAIGDDEKIVDDVNVSDESNDDAYFSPNVSNKSQSENNTTSSNSSSYSYRNISGPRPRPGLRRSSLLSLSESSLEMRKTPTPTKTSRDATPRKATNAFRESPKEATANVSPSFPMETDENPTRETVDPSPPKIPRARNSLNASRYSSSILTSDSSFDYTPFNSPWNSRNTGKRCDFQRASLDRNQNASSVRTPTVPGEREDTFGRRTSSEFNKTISFRSSTVKTVTVTEEIGRPWDDNIIMEVEDFGLDRASESSFIGGKRMSQRVDEQCIGGGTQTSQREESEETEQSEIILETQREQSFDSDQRKADDHSEESIQRNNDATTGETREHHHANTFDEEAGNDSDDYEEELLALKDKEEDDAREETFQSLLNLHNTSLRKSPSKEAESRGDSGKKSVETNASYSASNRTNEDLNITEDESSESVDRYLTKTKDSSHAPQSLETLYYASNITDDESNDGVDANDVDTHDSTFKSGRTEVERDSKRQKRATDVGDVFLENRRASIRHGEVTDNLEYSDLATSPSIPDVTDDVEKLDETRRRKSLPKNQTSSDNQENFMSRSDSTGSQVSTKAIPSSLSSDSERTIPTKSKVSRSKRNVESAQETSTRVTRSQRASSLAREIAVSSESDSRSGTPEIEKTRRTQRASSLAKEALLSSAKVILEAIPQSLPSEQVAEEQPVRRSTRRATSVQKDMMSLSSRLINEGKPSTSSRSRGTEDSAEEQLDKKSSKRRRGASLSKDLDSSLAGRTRRGSSVAKETTEKTQDTVGRTTRKRETSVPKESVLNTSRTRRSSSLAKDIVPAEVGSPAANTRSRRNSIQSIPEEMEESSSDLPEAKSSTAATEKKKKASRDMTRERRAMSLEPAGTETRRKSRSILTKSVLAEQAIEEEPFEEEARTKPKEMKSSKRTTRRTRTASGTSIKEIHDDEENVEEGPPPEKPRRGRATSERSNEDVERFQFSPPDETLGPPTEEQDVGKVPKYIFSPPHTRSKNPATTPHRRRQRPIRNFVSPLTDEEKRSAPKQIACDDKSANNRMIPNRALPTVRLKYVLPRKRSSSAS